MTNSRYFICLLLACGLLTLSNSPGAMGLRSLVALPVDKGGSVVRLSLQFAEAAEVDTLLSNFAYGISAEQTLLLGLPYRIDPGGEDRRGDLSLLYRHIVGRRDYLEGTDRLGLLLGALLPSKSENDSAVQAGLVFTHFKNRNEFDGDLVYRFGNDDRPDSARYDLSWQYRLSPARRPAWGLPPELNSVLELNGRWLENEDVVYMATVGLQWVHPRLVLEGGIVRDISNGDETLVLLGTRLHF